MLDDDIAQFDLDGLHRFALLSIPYQYTVMPAWDETM
jgi:hypothetical protein